MKNTILLFCLLLLMLFTSCAPAKEDLKLWYTQPAQVWEEALPLGNARIGTMVYGIPQREELQLNEETIWAGGPYQNDSPKALESLSKVRELIFEEKNSEADKIINQTFFTQTHGMPFQAAGSLILNFEGHDNFENYYRELNLDQAVAVTRYTVDGVEYTREVFSSFADDVIVMQITANKQGALSFEAEYTNGSVHSVSEKDNVLILEGKGGDHEGIEGEIKYQIHTAIDNKDGTVEVTNHKILVKDATVATIYLSIATNFVDYKTVGTDQGEKAASKLAEAMKVEYKTAIKQHTQIYSKQFSRFKLDLGDLGEESQLPTTQRIINFQNNQDPALVTLLSQFGRYLLICSSQPGGQPANLQGIWCNSMYPAWDSKYTININTEMNYWPAEVTNLSETHQPLFQMLKELSESGQKTAKTLYGAEGWVAHHNTDIWRVTSPIDFAAAGMWPTGGAWLVQHLWEHYLFTGDKEFLEEIYPILKGSADYFMTALVEHPKSGWMVVSPSVSPEHGPISAGCTMDNHIVFDVLTRTAMAGEILGKDKAYGEQLLAMVDKLPPMQIGKYSQLQEWLEDKDDPKSEHRHVSHLYGLYPGNQITPSISPELFEAARNSLLYRGDMATGWSIGWKINLWARLLDGNHAYKIIKNMLTLASQDDEDGRTYPNLFTAHPPFQIDGNFGLTAGLAEMLVQSHDGAVHLLPAIPDRWKNGEVAGIVARGAFEIDMKWKNNKISEVAILSKLGGNLRIRSYVPLKGNGIKQAEGENKNPFFKLADIRQAIISDEASFDGNTLKTIYEYDIMTEVGKDYRLKIER